MDTGRIYCDRYRERYIMIQILYLYKYYPLFRHVLLGFFCERRFLKLSPGLMKYFYGL